LPSSWSLIFATAVQAARMLTVPSCVARTAQTK
jgi:hypothetical protein